VIAVLRPGGDDWRLDGVACERLELDLEDREQMTAAVHEARPDWIFSLGAHGAYSWQTDRARMVRVNVDAVSALLEAGAAIGAERLIHAGTSSEYGVKDHAPDESEPVQPTSDYAETKAAATQLLAAARRGRPTTVVLRLYSAYGPWEEPGRLVPTLVEAALHASLPPLVDPTVARDFVYVDDVVSAFMLAARSNVEDGSVFNVASGTQTTIRDIVSTARRVFAVSAAPEWGSMPDRAWDTGTWVGRPERIRRALGWTPTVSLEEGLRRMGTWLEGNRELRQRYTSR
jgi:nucleoside-diphosphate-sugar epimerase